MSRLVATLRRACASYRRRADHRRPQVLGDQRGVLVSHLRIAAFDRGGQTPVQLRASGFELSFIGHRTNQRMAKHVLGFPSELNLVDQLGRN
jgi:hypothetical protein